MSPMNLTISVDDRLLGRARALAQERGISLQDLIRSYLVSITGERTPDDVADELMQLMRNAGGRSGGQRVMRKDAYEGRT